MHFLDTNGWVIGSSADVLYISSGMIEYFTKNICVLCNHQTLNIDIFYRWI